MKRYRQPLSEEFFYSSPEKLPCRSFRWIRPGPPAGKGQNPAGEETRDAAKRKA
ncbi:MAG: hypothetical protein KZQ88_05000 [Candidatus Thiodiazotropha sp. (ex Dulcina madagascariensis)]|nr:hypothetical protein [Candidatus Thiodiazotropha sp. (ex Epidulcina cf. delphinae)]MCU7922037.1 hypothetical protein [Candidatus Thiodiazotropha sp. (ex Dulcina madagascariensis)]MCU7926515.1 hypothetical protein [Candidatus Thiodiazotropha sp. (ex Dulcina madagascariensis)]